MSRAVASMFRMLFCTPSSAYGENQELSENRANSACSKFFWIWRLGQVFFYLAWPKRTKETQERSLRWTDFVVSFLIGKPHGYGSIPIDTIFSGMNIHLPAILMFTRGTKVLTHCYMLRVLRCNRFASQLPSFDPMLDSAIINGAPLMQRIMREVTVTT